jgi:hypothetical protein
MFRPAAILPVHGERSKTKLYRVAYAIARPLLPLLMRLFPSHVTTTEILARAMLGAARNGAPTPIFEPVSFRIQKRSTF